MPFLFHSASAGKDHPQSTSEVPAAIKSLRACRDGTRRQADGGQGDRGS